MTSLLIFSTFYIFLVADASVYNLDNKVVPQRRQQHSSTFVSFSAGLTQIANLSTNATVVFDRVWINTGNAYDTTNGIFTCPVAGVYVFMYHGFTQNNGQMWLDLYKNDAYQLTSFAHNTGDYDSASNSIVLTLKYGDTVYIRGHGSSQLYGQPDEIYSTFSGFILIPNEGQGQPQNA